MKLTREIMTLNNAQIALDVAVTFDKNASDEVKIALHDLEEELNKRARETLRTFLQEMLLEPNATRELAYSKTVNGEQLVSDTGWKRDGDGNEQS